MSPALQNFAAFRSVTIVAAVALAFASPAMAQDDNPFARPGGAAAAGPTPTASPLDTLELRGVMTLGDATFVTLFDTANSRSTVMTLGGTANGVTVTEYQVGDDSVLVQSGGNSKRVKMKTAKIVAMAMPPPQAMPLPQPGGPAVAVAAPVPGQPGAVGDEEVRTRMERVAQEIRRRREMRREIMERQGQQPPPQAPQ